MNIEYYEKAFMFALQDLKGSEHAMSKANLICAAPDLLDALKDMYGVLDARLPDGRAVNQILPENVSDLFYGPAIKARMAILKAEGKV